MNPPRSYYRIIKDQRCMCCGDYGTHGNPIEAAHIESVLSQKTNMMMPRSHKGPAGWGAIPLCKRCHGLQHYEGDEKGWLSTNVGRERAQGKIIANLIEYIERKENDSE